MSGVRGMLGGAGASAGKTMSFEEEAQRGFFEKLNGGINRVGGPMGATAIMTGAVAGLTWVEMKYDFLADLTGTAELPKPYVFIKKNSWIVNGYFEHRALTLAFCLLGMGCGIKATFNTFSWLSSLYVYQAKGRQLVLPSVNADAQREFEDNLPHLITKEKLIDLATTALFLTTLIGSGLAVSGCLTLISPSLLVGYASIIGAGGAGVQALAKGYDVAIGSRKTKRM